MTDGPTGRPLQLGRRSLLLGAAAMGVAACAGSSPRVVRPHRPHRHQPLTIPYGSDPYQVADLWLPPEGDTSGLSTAKRPVVVLVHGDFWEPEASRAVLTPLAQAVATRGWVAWNIDYRPLGHGGGWPQTFVDGAQAVDHLAAISVAHRLDLGRVAAVGHSVGGTFALWSAARHRLPLAAPGSRPKVRPAIAVSLAGVNDLAAAAFEDLGDGAVDRFMGVEPIDPDGPYSVASPSELLPFGVRQVIVYGTADQITPASQSTAYAAKAQQAGDDATLVAIRGASHFDLIDAAKAGWAKVTTKLAQVLER